MEGIFEKSFNITQRACGRTGTGAADTTYTHYGRIALFDYHNVRGRGRTQVAMSNTTAWRGTSL